MDNKISVTHRTGDYDIIFGDIFGNINEYLTERDIKYFIVTDDIVFDLHAGKLLDSLLKRGYNASCHVIKSGESEKNLSTVSSIYTKLAEFKFTRGDIILAVGGGVVGDIAGFCAATYLRGARFIQIPTTILAQIDSSIGGKTGVDLPEGKNLVGAFHQPSAVLCDRDVIKTLPSDVYSDAFGEIIKYACLFDEGMFSSFEKHDYDIYDIIAKCARFKAEIVMEDEFEKNIRACLNLGHTIGHAAEKYYSFTGLTHGKAVALGIVYAAKFSYLKGFCSLNTLERTSRLVKTYGLPFRIEADNEILAENCTADKKRTPDGIKFIFINEIGRYRIEKIGQDELKGLLYEADKLDDLGVV